MGQEVSIPIKWGQILAAIVIATAGFGISQVGDVVLGKSGTDYQVAALAAQVSDMRGEINAALREIVASQVDHRINHPDKALAERITVLEGSQLTATEAAKMERRLSDEIKSLCANCR